MPVSKVSISGVNTKKLPVFTDKEKDELFLLIEDGNQEARERFIEGNLRLVLSIVQRFSQSNENPDDLFQVGCIGLIKSIDNFDRSIGVKFSTYAVPMIIGEVRRYIRDNGAIRVSRSLRDIAYKATYAKEIFIKTNDREPTIEELSMVIGIDKADIQNAFDAIARPVSLYEPVFEEGSDALYIMDQVSDKKNKEENWVKSLALSDALAKLNDREKNIIQLRFFEGKTQTEVSKMINISQAQVSRLEKDALRIMRSYLRD